MKYGKNIFLFRVKLGCNFFKKNSLFLSNNINYKYKANKVSMTLISQACKTSIILDIQCKNAKKITGGI